VQRLINTRFARAYRTVSNEALCILTGLRPITIKIDEIRVFQFYQLTRGSTEEDELVVSDMEVKHWHHPAETIIYLTEVNEEASTTQIFTDGSKSKQGEGASIAIFRSGNHIKSLKYGLNERSIDNQAENLAILRALEYTENIQTEKKTAIIYTDSRMILDSLKYSNIHTYII
jgi:hypothetical protein